jgi:Uma2 family endonuclease
MSAQSQVGWPRPFLYTREQYREMCRLGFFDGARVELISGQLFEIPAPDQAHAVGRRKTVAELERVFVGVAWVGAANPFHLTHSEPRPDVAVFAGRFEDYTTHPTTALLVVEVADTTLAFDTTTKAELYATANVAEYWVLDVTGRELHVFRDPGPLPASLGRA